MNKTPISMILAFEFMQYDIDAIKRDMEMKANKRDVNADRELITYKLDILMQEEIWHQSQL